jgi:putative ATPase
MVASKHLFSMILFGPPGCGKTTLALAITRELNLEPRFFNATHDNKKLLENYIAEAHLLGTIVLIADEIHRLNKDKQDILLPHLEDGSIILIGATTTNPYHSINPAIRSRTILVELKPLTKEDIKERLRKAIDNIEILGSEVVVEEDALDLIAHLSGGDLRYALNSLEILAFSNKVITKEIVIQQLGNINVKSDKDDDVHYDLMSALQKSIRGSDVDAALYYLARLIQNGDLLALERRLLVTAYEDIGLANPAAVDRVVHAFETAKIVGFPEAAIPLGFAVCDLALSPKSKSSCQAIQRAQEVANSTAYEVPKYLRLTPHNLNEEDKYPYDRPDLWAFIQYLPIEIKDKVFFIANDTGSYERSLGQNHLKLKANLRSANLKNLKKRTNFDK